MGHATDRGRLPQPRVQRRGQPHRRVSKRKLRAPSLLPGVFSGPLDLVAAGRAPGAEEPARLLVLIARRLDGIPDDRELEAVGGDSLPEVLSDAELDARLVQYLSVERPAPPDGPPDEGGLESIGDSEDAIAARLAEASPEQLAEIDVWLGGAPEPEEAWRGSSTGSASGRPRCGTWRVGSATRSS